MKVLDTALPGVKLIEPAVYGDARGYFFEAFNRGRFAEAGLPTDEFQPAEPSKNGAVVEEF